MHKVFTLLFILSLSPLAHAQKTKLKCAVKPPVTKSCSLQKDAATDLKDTSQKIKEVCAKNEFSDEYLEAYKEITATRSSESIFLEEERSIKYNSEKIVEIKDFLKKMHTGEYKERIALAKKISKGWEKIAQLAISGDKNLLEKEKEKNNKLHSEFKEKFGDVNFNEYHLPPNEVKNQLKATEEGLRYHQKKHKILSEIKNSLSGPEQKSELERAIFSAEINMRVDDVKKRKTFTDCGFSNQEIIAIYLYTAENYNSLNPALREKDEAQLKKFKPIIDTINSGLSKIQSHAGTVKRGADLPEKIADLHCPGCIVTYDAYTSASSEMGFPGTSTFVIQSKNGKYVAPLSHNPYEEEVLFAPGAKFKILNVKNMPNKTQYTMSEQ